MLSENQWQELRRIAAHVTRTSPRQTPALRGEAKFEVALDALIQFVHELGWPADGDYRDMFRAANNAIAHEDREIRKHLAHGAFWLEPRGEHDAMAERVTDRVGVWQLTWLFTESEWTAVWAAAQAPGGSQRQQASLAGMPISTFNHNLLSARRAARQAWIAPDETARGYFRSGRQGVKSKAGRAAAYRRKKERDAA